MKPEIPFREREQLETAVRKLWKETLKPYQGLASVCRDLVQIGSADSFQKDYGAEADGRKLPCRTAMRFGPGGFELGLYGEGVDGSGDIEWHCPDGVKGMVLAGMSGHLRPFLAEADSILKARLAADGAAKLAVVRGEIEAYNRAVAHFG